MFFCLIRADKVVINVGDRLDDLAGLPKFVKEVRATTFFPKKQKPTARYPQNQNPAGLRARLGPRSPGRRRGPGAAERRRAEMVIASCMKT